MTIKLIAAASLLFLLSCNSGEKEKSSTTESTQTTTATDDDAPAADKEAQKAALNEQSKACIRMMNQLEEQKNAALAAGDMEKARALTVSIDSAAKANIMIGQQLMALDK